MMELWHLFLWHMLLIQKLTSSLCTEETASSRGCLKTRLVSFSFINFFSLLQNDVNRNAQVLETKRQITIWPYLICDPDNEKKPNNGVRLHINTHVRMCAACIMSAPHEQTAESLTVCYGVFFSHKRHLAYDTGHSVTGPLPVVVFVKNDA